MKIDSASNQDIECFIDLLLYYTAREFTAPEKRSASSEKSASFFAPSLIQGGIVAHANNNSLRFGQPVPSFFFPQAHATGPDVVFYIRVEDNMFPVFVQHLQTLSSTRSRLRKSWAMWPNPAVMEASKNTWNGLSSAMPYD